MFKKPFKVKSNSQLKGSDRKKLRGDILQQFPNLTEEALNLVLPNKDSIFQLKVITHSGDIVIVYCVQKLPIIFEIEKVMYPTTYMLWHVPDLLHIFTTHTHVFRVIAGGADLMLPGVVIREMSLHAYGRLQKGDRVAVNLTNNKAPIAVGKAVNSSYDMYMSAKRGKCVEVLHFYGDSLSTYGTKLVMPELGPVFENEVDEIKQSDSSTSQQCEKSTVGSLASSLDTAHLSLDEGGEHSVESRVSDLANSELTVENSDIEPTPVSPENGTIDSSSSSMDELLKNCFLKSLRTSMKKVDLPLLTSNFYKLHMIPACPANKTLDIKKSSYKKLSNFLDEMVKNGVIQIEALQKGVQSISKIEYNHELVIDFVDDFSNEVDKAGLVVDNTCTSKSSVPEISEKFTVTAAVLPLFYKYDYKKKEAVTRAVVHKVISDYVKVNNLQNPKNREEVLLDGVLRSASNAPSDAEVSTWLQLTANIFGQMGHAYKVELSTGQVSLANTKLPPIDIHVGTRSGNKKVTLVNNLEIFGINVSEFSRECQHGVAASTTINMLPMAKSAQVQIQGNQVVFVGKLLMEKYQIPKRYIRGLEKAPKKKK